MGSLSGSLRRSSGSCVISRKMRTQLDAKSEMKLLFNCSLSGCRTANNRLQHPPLFASVTQVFLKEQGCLKDCYNLCIYWSCSELHCWYSDPKNSPSWAKESERVFAASNPLLGQRRNTVDPRLGQSYPNCSTLAASVTPATTALLKHS